MKSKSHDTWQPVVQAISFALYFVLLVVSYKAWQSDFGLWKVLLPAATGLLLIWFIKKKQFVELCGFVMLMTGANLLWQSADIPVFCKVVGFIAVVLQFGTLGKESAEPSQE
ncbi:MAG: hypothetical protein WDO14_13670 [Bacteroidota bacterium]